MDADEQLSILSSILPNRWFFWALAALATLIVFPLYYIHGPYPALNRWFEQNRWHDCGQEEGCQQTAEFDDWLIHVRTPRYGADFVTVPLEIKLTNTLSETRDAVINVSLCRVVNEFCGHNPPVNARISLEGVEQNSAILSSVPPDGETLKTFQVRLPSEEDSLGNYRVRVRLNGVELSELTLPLDFNADQVFKLWTTEHLLSPPGSSILLPLIVLLFSGLLEKVFEWGLLVCELKQRWQINKNRFRFRLVLRVVGLFLVAVILFLVLKESYSNLLPDQFRDSLNFWLVGIALVASFLVGIIWGFLQEGDSQEHVTGTREAQVQDSANGTHDRNGGDQNNDRQGGNAAQHENDEEAEQGRQDEQATELENVGQEDNYTSKIAFLPRLPQLTSESLKSLFQRIGLHQPQVDDPAKDREEANKPSGDVPTNPESVQSAIQSVLNDTRLWLQTAPPPVSASMLDYLQRQHPTLPEFYEYYALVKSPDKEHLIILHKSVEATDSSFLIDCTDNQLLTNLLELCKVSKEEVVRFRDGIGLLDAFVTIGSPEAKTSLQNELWSLQRQEDPYLVKLTLETLHRAAARKKGKSPIATEDLLFFMKAINQPDEKQFEQMVAIVCHVSRKKDWPDLHDELKRFLKKGEKMVDEALSGELAGIRAEQIVNMCLFVAERIPIFAEWFIYEKLANLPELSGGKFENYFKQIGPGLTERIQSPEGGRLAQLVHDDWWQGAIPESKSTLSQRLNLQPPEIIKPIVEKERDSMDYDKFSASSDNRNK